MTRLTSHQRSILHELILAGIYHSAEIARRAQCDCRTVRRHAELLDVTLPTRPRTKEAIVYARKDAKARYDRLRESGMCVTCAKPAHGKARCAHCAAKQRASLLNTRKNGY